MSKTRSLDRICARGLFLVCRVRFCSEDCCWSRSHIYWFDIQFRSCWSFVLYCVGHNLKAPSKAGERNGPSVDSSIRFSASMCL